MKRIGILVSGGDAPGVNSVIEAATRCMVSYGAEAWGINGGFSGLLAGRLQRLEPTMLVGVSAQGGALLGTSRERVLAEPGAKERLRQVWADFRLDGLLIMGGDGTIRQASKILLEWGYPLLAIPCTIDNDVPLTDRTLGHDSACNRALPLIDAIRDTATALPGRLFAVETLGGHTGHIAIALAFAAHADAVCVPEIEIDVVRLGKTLVSAVEAQGYGLCIIGEGVGNVPRLCNALADAAGYRIRLTSMGHAQRGGPPSFFDRRLARAWGELAVRQLLAGFSGHMLAWQAGTTGLIPLTEVSAAPPKAIDMERYVLINGE
jgi:6-phosphofructokinase 1